MQSVTDYHHILSMLTLSTGKLDLVFLSGGPLQWVIPASLVMESFTGRLFQRSQWPAERYASMNLKNQGCFNFSPERLEQMNGTYQTNFYCLLDGAGDRERIILVADAMPVPDKVRISAVKDISDLPHSPAFCYQMVEINQKYYAIPDLRTILQTCKIV